MVPAVRRNIEALLFDQGSKPLRIARNSKVQILKQNFWKKSLALDNRISFFLILSLLLTLHKPRKYNTSWVCLWTFKARHEWLLRSLCTARANWSVTVTARQCLAVLLGACGIWIGYKKWYLQEYQAVSGWEEILRTLNNRCEFSS